jgi:hypothetical protein
VNAVAGGQGDRIYESLESAIDACETVAHILEGISLKRRWAAVTIR